MEEDKKFKILLIDDVETSRELLCDIVETMGYEPVAAKDAEDALEILKTFTPDLIITDIYMPGMSGIELCTQLKRNMTTRNIPVIFTSADGMDVIQEGFRAGGEDFIDKPFNARLIRARISLHLELTEARCELMEVNRKLQASVKSQMNEMEIEKERTLKAMAAVVVESSHFSKEHFERLKYDSKIIAEALQLTNEYAGVISDGTIQMIEEASPLAEILTAGASNTFFKDSDELNGEEKIDYIRKSGEAAKVVKDLLSDGKVNEFLKTGFEVICYNGCIFNSAEIPLSAQIVAVAKKFVSLTEERPFRKAYSKSEALELIDKEAGTYFNPDICRVTALIANQLK